MIASAVCSFNLSVDQSANKSGRPVPAYDAEWYKGYIYTYVPTLSAITNRNVFLLGSADILFTLFYSCLEEELVRQLNSLAAQA